MAVLVVRTGGLGDCLITLPVVRTAAETHPGSPVHVLGNAMMGEVARLTGWIEGVYAIDRAAFARLFSPARPDAFLTSFFSQYSHVYFFSSTGVPGALARKVSDAGAGVCRVLDPRPPAGFRSHIVHHLFEVFPADIRPPFEVDRPARMFDRSHETVVRKSAVVHPGSGGCRKNWPLDRFREVAGTLGKEVTFVLGPAEIERGMGESLGGAGYPVETPGSIGELARIIAQASVFMGNDSGVAHLASMTETPAVVLYGHTDPAVWRPVGMRVAPVISPDGEMSGITVSDVLRAIREVHASGAGAP
ncbi:glycosyltransferase family 9 protein [Candidatus Latescibacterota bacterium]